MRRLFVRTFGCQMNRYDSERLVEILSEHRFEYVEDYRCADLIFINTCTVRDKAEQKAFSYLGRLKALKRRRPDLVIALGGCVAQQHGEDLLRKIPHLDLVVGTHGIRAVSAMLDRYETTGERQSFVDFDYDFGDEPAGRPNPWQPRASSYVTIMRGCDNLCTYCIVPKVRGREVSRPSDEIIMEVESLVRSGVREVTLLGQNVNSYGQKAGGGDRLCRIAASCGQGGEVVADSLHHLTSKRSVYLVDKLFCGSPIPVPSNSSSRSIGLKPDSAQDEARLHQGALPAIGEETSGHERGYSHFHRHDSWLPW